MRVPNLEALTAEPAKAPTLREAAEKWRAERTDVAEGTAVLHRVALARVLPTLGARRIDEMTVADVKALVAELARQGKKRETIRKSVKYLAAVLDDQGIDPNPARDKSIRFPRQGKSWAEIGRFVGQRKLSVTADVYTHVMIEAREVDYADLIPV
jgi:hypothetical protein